MEPEVSDDRAESLGIHVRVTRVGCDAFMAQENLHVAQVGSALVEKECRGRMPQGMRGNMQVRPRTAAPCSLLRADILNLELDPAPTPINSCHPDL